MSRGNECISVCICIAFSIKLLSLQYLHGSSFPRVKAFLVCIFYAGSEDTITYRIGKMRPWVRVPTTYVHVRDACCRMTVWNVSWTYRIYSSHDRALSFLHIRLYTRHCHQHTKGALIDYRLHHPASLSIAIYLAKFWIVHSALDTMFAIWPPLQLAQQWHHHEQSWLTVPK